MNESEIRLYNHDKQKAQIRQRYKGIDSSELEIIPALPPTDFYDDQKEKQVAIYARVSTDDPRQTSSYELQKNHYQDMVNQHPNWKLAEIYADEGISGTSLQHRNSFLRMIDDCSAGKIDLIVTKSVSRFARNILDCISYIRQLAAMEPPIGVFFETENIFTLNSNSEMTLSFISTLAQEESHTKSEIMNASIEMRFKRGIFLTPTLFGYQHDPEGNLIIHEEEAKIVRLIFFLYLCGHTCKQIADCLTKLGVQTKTNKSVWSPSTILCILQNERHCGDVLARKTWTPNFLDHKSKKNRYNRNQYLKKDHHEAIISRDDFIAVQKLISNAKYGARGILPELYTIPNGALKGFVSVNPRWSGFKSADYKNASLNVYTDNEEDKKYPLQVKSGEFDLRRYEVARTQFFNTANKLSITFSRERITFSSMCIKKFDSQYVEMFLHPAKLLFILKPSVPENRNAIRWSKNKNGTKVPRSVSGNAFLPNLYDLFEWDITCRYRIIGIQKGIGNESILLFNLKETEILTGTKNSTITYPADWADSFGDNYYHQTQIGELAAFYGDQWKTHFSGKPYNPYSLKVTDSDELETNIEIIINEIKQEKNATDDHTRQEYN